MWKNFIKKKPKKSRWYLCTVEVKNFQRYTMNLYWDDINKKFIDNIRANVVQTYKVINYFGERIYDIGQDRTDNVVAWKYIPNPYMRGFIKE